MVGRAEVSVEEVMLAFKSTRPGKSPGWDGIPTDLYKVVRAELAPTLAELFTAVGQLSLVPGGFLDGVITILYKDRGARSHPGSYRPITLLCIDYRLLAKVLANRLGHALGEVVTLEQSAFLPKRLIGANVMFLRHLPHLMRQQNRSCVIAFLDIAKAYDSLDRDFLLGAMDAMGAGSGLLGWVRTLLADTCSVAVVNGYRSSPVQMRAGVRQGCPLAPLLYLFAAQALLCWLQAGGVGIRLQPKDADLVTAVQFADDTEVVLDGPEAVPQFLRCMEVYSYASGQRLNVDKVELLTVGRAGGSSAAAVGGLKVVSTATALNLPFANAGDEPHTDWTSHLQKVGDRLQRVACLSLSIFGRATAAAAYALNRFTWHMEHGGMPPAPTVATLEQWGPKVIDRGLGPEMQSD